LTIIFVCYYCLMQVVMETGIRYPNIQGIFTMHEGMKEHGWEYNEDHMRWVCPVCAEHEAKRIKTYGHV
jgi:hypothetical protein